ncbi:MAG: hypothetical protein NZ988_00475 [Thaumarchaeota archaeon]|nr:hypothetical protein [Candidatus Calditenuaceae archaeon]
MNVLRYGDPFGEQAREMITLIEAETDQRYGKPPELRTIEERLEFGYVAIDKHAGPTSHDIVNSVRRVLGVERAGHGGTLEA